MQTEAICLLDTIAVLESFMDSHEEIRLYGAGYYLNLFLQEVVKLNREYLKKIKCIMVSNIAGNPEVIKGIPVMVYRNAGLKKGDVVLLTLGARYVDEVCNLLDEYTGRSCIVQLDFNVFYERAYYEVKESIQPLLDRFPEHLLCLNEPAISNKIMAWTCWWQGVEKAPDIVKACIESQRRNIPEGVRHVIITEENYRDYITLPAYIIEKVKSGDIGLPHLADIIRVNLLYKYGGFWMDAEVLVLEPIPKDILGYPIYTRNLPERQFYTNAMWAIGFLYAEPGSRLFHFLSESFFYYFSVHERLKYYFTLDYMIAVACHVFSEVEEQFKSVPYNNDKAFELEKHLLENFEQEKYDSYIRGTYIQFLSHKLEWVGKKITEGTIYEHILKSYL